MKSLRRLAPPIVPAHSVARTSADWRRAASRRFRLSVPSEANPPPGADSASGDGAQLPLPPFTDVIWPPAE